MSRKRQLSLWFKLVDRSAYALRQLRAKWTGIFIVGLIVSITSLLEQFHFVADTCLWLLDLVSSVETLHSLFVVMGEIVHTVINWWRVSITKTLLYLQVNTDPVIMDLLSAIFFIAAQSINRFLPYHRESRLLQKRQLKLTQIEQEATIVGREADEESTKWRNDLYDPAYDDDDHLGQLQARNFELQRGIFDTNRQIKRTASSTRKLLHSFFMSTAAVLITVTTLYAVDYWYMQYLAELN